MPHSGSLNLSEQRKYHPCLSCIYIKISDYKIKKLWTINDERGECLKDDRHDGLR